MGWLSSIFTGQNETLNKDKNQFGQIGDFATGMGEKNLSDSSKFWSGVLSGDSSKVSKTLAPQIGQAKTSAQQENKSRSEFGSRSGGTAAANASTSDKVHSDITSLIGSLTGKAADTLGSQGSNLLQQGTAAYGKEADASQQQMQNWSNSILGTAITGGVNYAESFLPTAHGGKG